MISNNAKETLEHLLTKRYNEIYLNFWNEKEISEILEVAKHHNLTNLINLINDNL